MSRPKHLTLFALIVLAGCPSARPDPGGEGGNMTGKKEQGMGNCPSAVPGAKTRVTLRDDGVDVEVTALDPAAQREIRERASSHAILPRQSAAPRHSGAHGGPGTMGWCPVVHEATIITSTDVPGGAVIHVQARTAEGIPALQQITMDRVGALAVPRPTGPQ